MVSKESTNKIEKKTLHLGKLIRQRSYKIIHHILYKRKNFTYN
jgi:hypothetical protein